MFTVPSVVILKLNEINKACFSITLGHTNYETFAFPQLGKMLTKGSKTAEAELVIITTYLDYAFRRF